MSVWMILGGIQYKAGTPWYIHTLKQPLRNVLRLDSMHACFQWKHTWPVVQNPEIAKSLLVHYTVSRLHLTWMFLFDCRCMPLTNTYICNFLTLCFLMSYLPKTQTITGSVYSACVSQV